MKLKFRHISVCLALAGLGCVPAFGAANPELAALLSRLDRAAADFKAMTAQVAYVTHTDVLNEDNSENGRAVMKKVQPGEVQGLVEFGNPDPHTITFEKRHVQRFFPKIKTLEVYDLEKNGEQLDRFLMIGFGTSGMELAKDYDVTWLGVESAKETGGARTVHVRLVPKSSEAKQYVKNMELWIPEQGDPYPLRERVLQPSGDYQVITYTDVKINPALKPDALQVKLPAGVKTIYPGK